MPAEDPPQEGPPHAAPSPGGWETVRRHFRSPVTLPILCRTARGEAGSSPRFWFSRTVNLSAVGTALLLPESLAPGARVGLLLELEGRTLEFEATVQSGRTADIGEGGVHTVGEQLAADLYIEEFLRRARGEAPS